MKKLSLNVDLAKLNLTDEETKKNPCKISLQVLDNVIIGYAQQNKGLIETDRKLFYTIHDKLENLKSSTDNTDTIELSDEELGFIRKCFRETKLMPNDLLRQVENNIDKTKV